MKLPIRLRGPGCAPSVVLLLALPAAVQAQFVYTTNTSNAAITITGYTGPGGAVAIPDMISGLPVTGIGDAAFRGASVTSATLPDSIENLGSFAFSGCTSLSDVVIGNGVTNVGDGAFYQCSVLATVVFGTNVTSIGAQAFQHSGLTSASLPNGVLTLGTDAFGGCSSLTNISLGTLLTRLGDYTFFGCSNLTSITLPNKVNTVGVYAFSDCVNLTDVTLPTALTNISQGMFSSCSHLGTVTIPSSVTSIGSSAFFECTGLIGIYFQGNAPTPADTFIFLADASAKAYYLPGTSGWGPTFAGIPALLLNPTNSTGSLQVTISPDGAIANGAKFEVDGGPPQNSAEPVSNLAPGSHIVSFTPASGYTAPGNLIVSVSANSLATVTGNYVPLVVPTNASLTIGPAPNQQINLGDPVAICLPFSDSIAGASHTATLDWGDGAVETGLMDERASTVSGTHLYHSPDLFTIVVTLQANYGLTANAFLYVTATAPNAPPVVKVPALSIAPVAPFAISLTWPQTGGSFWLEQSANVGSQADWVAAPFVPLASQGYFRALAPIDSATRFFRLADVINTNPPSPSPLQLTINLPVTSFSAPFRTNAISVTLAGTINDPNAVVTVQGVRAPLAQTNWIANAVNLPQEGPNLILIAATNLAGAQTVEDLVITRDTVILPPLDLQALATGPTTVHLSWINGQPNVQSTLVYKRTTAASVLLTSVAASATSFDDTDTVAGGPAFYKAQVIDDLGNLSPFSPEVSVSTLGSGSAAGFSLTGGSINSVGHTSSSITPTALIAPNPIRETNGDVRVRYLEALSFGDDLPGVTGYSPHLSRAELPSPPCLSWPDNNFGNTERSLIVHVEKASGFGSTLQATVSAPPGWIISSNTFALPPRIGYGSFALNADGFAGTFDNGVLCWGTYPSYPNPGLGPFPPPWASNRSLTFMGDAWTDTNATYTLNPNQLSFSVDSPGIKGTNGANLIVSSGPGNIIEFGFALTLLPVDPIGCALDRTPRLQITANGTQVEMGIGLQMDPDPFNLPCLRQPIDDAGGTLNLFTGDYSFQVPLFAGRGFGLNIEGILSYSSVNASWDLAALQQSSPTNYSLMPLGPGWGYSYGMRVIRHDVTNWIQGVPSLSNSTLIVVCPDGRVIQWPFNIVSNRYESLESATTVAFGNFSAYSSLVHPPTPLWAHFSHGVIVPTPSGGYVLREANQATEGFQEIDFDDLGRMTNIVAKGGVRPVSISYQGGNQIVTDSSGRKTMFAFDGSGRINEVTDPSGGDWVLTYSGRALTRVHEKATGYGWQFAYDPVNYLLTERQLPHGFIVQASYDTAPVSNGRFFWGALTNTNWKETPSTSTRTIVYDRQNAVTLTNNPNELFTPPFLLATTNSARVSINTPSGRNTEFFDIAGFSSLLQNNVSAASYAMVISSDQGSNALRYIATDVSAFWSKATQSSPTLANNENENHTNALGDSVQLLASGAYTSKILREDGGTELWEYRGTTLHSPTRLQLWRGFEYDYQYLDPSTSHERLLAVFPPGQSSLNPGARSTRYDYDSHYRIQSVTDMDSNVTRLVYYDTAGRLGLPHYVVPCYNQLPSVPNPNTWTYDYDGLGRPTRVQDPDGNVTTNVYDPAGRLTKVLGPARLGGTSAIPQTTYEYQGDLVARIVSVTTDQENQWIAYTYDSQRRLIEVDTPGNAGPPSKTQFAYDADNNTTNVVYPNHGTDALTYDNRGRLTRSVGPEGESVEHDYDDKTDEVTEVRLISGSQIRPFTVVRRDALKRPLQIQLPLVTQGGVTDRPQLVFSYDQDSGVTNRTYGFAGNSNNLSRAFGYFDELVQATIDMGGKQSMTQKRISDYAGRLSQAQGPTLISSGSANGPSSIVPQPNRQLPAVGNFTYNCFDSVSNITDGLNNEVVRFGVDPKGLLQSIATPDPSSKQPTANAKADTLVVALSHDNFSLVSKSTDVFGSTNAVYRDLSGRPTNIIDAVGIQSTINWSVAGDLSAASTVSGLEILDTTVGIHDDLGAVIQLIGPSTSSTNIPLTSLNYDRSGRLTNSVNALGNVAATAYDGFGEIIQGTYPSGAYITYARDGLGRVTNSSEYLPNQTQPVRTVSIAYDWQGGVSALSDDNYLIEYTWDNLGRLLTKCTTFNPIPVNPVVALASPLTATNLTQVTKCLTYSYGGFGNLVSITDDDGYTRKYTWDDQDNLIQIDFVPPTGVGLAPQTVLLHSDGVGQLQGLEFQSAGATVVSNSMARDAKGRLKDFSYIKYGTSVVPLPSYHYQYDARDLVTNVINSAQQTVTSFGYDQRGYLTSEIWTHQADGTQFYNDQIGYDAAGNRIWRQLNGNLTTYTNDVAYQLVSANQQSLVRILPSHIQATADSTYGPGFEPGLACDGIAPDSSDTGSGWRSSTNATDHWIDLALDNTYPVGAVEISVPTARGGLLAFYVEAAESAGSDLQIIPPSQITDGIGVSSNAASTHRHTTRVAFSPPQNASRVRLLVPQGGTGLNPTTGEQTTDVLINEVAVFQFVPQVTHYQYDPNGRLTNEGHFAYSYDVRGRLIGVQGANANGLSVNKSWTITPEGLRGSETDNLTGQTRYFVNDGANTYLEFTLTAATASPLLRHLSGPGDDDHLGFFESTKGSAEFRWCLTQGPGSVTQVLDSEGKVLDDRTYTAWGQDLLTPSSTSSNLYGFAGARQDHDTGLYYNRARMFDPQLGRFTSTDPAGMVEGPNPFLYAANDSVNGRDPSGLDEQPNSGSQPGRWKFMTLEDKATFFMIQSVIFDNVAKTTPAGPRVWFRQMGKDFFKVALQLNEKILKLRGAQIYSVGYRNAQPLFQILMAQQKQAEKVRTWTEIGHSSEGILTSLGGAGSARPMEIVQTYNEGAPIEPLWFRRDTPGVRSPLDNARWVIFEGFGIKTDVVTFQLPQ